MTFYTYYNCPRCDKPFTSIKCGCGMMWLRFTQVLIFSFSIRPFIIWDLSVDQCYLGIGGKEIRIPWLPFDVSQADIEKYLVLI
jgi:hypothetical protein